MDAILAALESLPPVQALRFSRWTYAAVNTAHIFGIALLFGAITPLNLRFFGFWKGVPAQTLMRVLSPVAAAGLALAVAAGFLLFATRAREYAANPFFLAKAALVALAGLSALLFHLKHGWGLAAASDRALFMRALVSALGWTGAIICGRMIAFAGS